MTRLRVLGSLLRPRCSKGSSTLSTATVMAIIWGNLRTRASHYTEPLPPVGRGNPRCRVLRQPAGAPVPPAVLLRGAGGTPAYQVEQPPDPVLHPGGMAAEPARAAAHPPEAPPGPV